MAVKKHDIVQDPRRPSNLIALGKYLKLMKERIHYLTFDELIKDCEDIVKCLARVQGPPSALWESLHIVEDFLVHVMNSVQDDVRHEIMEAILNTFHLIISDPQSNAAAATSVVLVVLSSNNDVAQSTTCWLVQQGEGPGGAGLRASLTCLYRWLSEWSATPNLGSWIMAYIKALEESERFDILIEVSVNNLGHLFSVMDEPSAVRQSTADVIFHVLSSLRESKEALDVLKHHVDRVLTNLASDSGQFSRQLLQTIVDILTEMVNGLANVDNNSIEFKSRYFSVYLCLERHMAWQTSTFLQLPPWRSRTVSTKPVNTCQPLPKVGLNNLGNTCYMNSIFQALLVTRKFSNHVMLEMSTVPYWAKMGILFAKMTHSFSESLHPLEFFKVFKPHFFTSNNQHDSSEFLGYLFELLHAFEHCSDVNFDYTKPAVLNGHFTNSNRLRSSSSQSTSTATSDTESTEPGPNHRSVSPRPGSSGSGSISSGSSPLKRSAKSEGLPLKKRFRAADTPPPAPLRRESFVDNTFGGILLIRVVCTGCHNTFVTRDAFRDLQLAFPEKPDGYVYSVQNLLEYYCSNEKLSGDNKYWCRECKMLRDAERSVLIESSPKYLVLVLKNFKFEPKIQVQKKLMHSIYHNQMVTLPMVRTQGAPASYTLYAAVVHRGTTLDSGHYYTLAKDNNTWYLYNDDTVTMTTESEVNELRRSCTPYVLFYRRMDIEEGDAPALKDLPPKVQEQVMSHNKEIVDNARNQGQVRIGCP